MQRGPSRQMRRGQRPRGRTDRPGRACGLLPRPSLRLSEGCVRIICLSGGLTPVSLSPQGGKGKRDASTQGCSAAGGGMLGVTLTPS